LLEFPLYPRILVGEAGSGILVENVHPSGNGFRKLRSNDHFESGASIPLRHLPVDFHLFRTDTILMSEFPLGYEIVAPASWAYMASLLLVALYFKFNRLWSIRNIDLILLILLAPGLLLVFSGSRGRASASLELNRHKKSLLEKPLQQSPGNPTANPEQEASKNPAGGSAGSPKSEESGFANPDTSKQLNSDKASGDVAQEVPSKSGQSEEQDSITGSETSEQSTDVTEGDISLVQGETGDDPGENERSAADEKAPLPSEQLAQADAKENQNLVDSALKVEPTNELESRLRRFQAWERWGYIWLFILGAVLAIRMLLDPMMARRPLLEPNLTFGGLLFLGCALLGFMIANIITSRPTPHDLYGVEGAFNVVERRANSEPEPLRMRHGPGYAVLHVLPAIATFVTNEQRIPQSQSEIPPQVYVVVAKVMAIICQVSLVLGIFLIGYLHFNNARMGIGIAVLYLLIPYTALMAGRVIHTLPATLLVWAIVGYRRPLLSGSLIGLAMGVVYYPFFLLPLWLSFYWRRGRVRFLIGVVSTIVVLAASLLFTSSNFADYIDKLRDMFGIWTPRMEGLQGIWALGWDSIYRLPFLAMFVVVSIGFTMWPAQKNLGTLISCSAALMIIVQYWHGFGGGLLMAWYLPLTLLTIFRPNLDDRVALKVLSVGRRQKTADVKQAA
jgi:hypothetical protein